MSSEVVISVDEVSKCYPIYEQPRDRLKQFILPRLRRIAGLSPMHYYREFWALNSISFEILKGETVGIIGRNGSGKSTLLQLICGTLAATSGHIRTSGRIAALLELGSGFNPEFSGRENVYMNASVLGLSKEEIDAKFNDILIFADIGEFIEQPVKAYSSGMLMRLAFAVIAHVNADILIVDEALSVGDVFFSQKCMRFFENFKTTGGTVLFVSHDTGAVARLCERVLLLSKGEIVRMGSANEVCKLYLEHLYAERKQPSDEAAVGDLSDKVICKSDEKLKSDLTFHLSEQQPNQIFISQFQSQGDQMGFGGATVLSAAYVDLNGNTLRQMTTGQRAILRIQVHSKTRISFPAVGLVIKDRLGQAVFTESTTWAFEAEYGDHGLLFASGDEILVDFEHTVPSLCAGEYAVTIAVAEGFGHDHIQHHLIHEALVLRVIGQRVVHGMAGLDALSTTIKIARPASSSNPAPKKVAKFVASYGV